MGRAGAAGINSDIRDNMFAGFARRSIGSLANFSLIAVLRDLLATAGQRSNFGIGSCVGRVAARRMRILAISCL